jgi:hypothetical protein
VQHGTSTNSPHNVDSTSRATASGINVINSVARIVAATLISRRATTLIFPIGQTCAAIRSIVPGSDATPTTCSSARIAGHPEARHHSPTVITQRDYQVEPGP